MTRDELQLLYDYHCWANARVLDAAARLAEQAPERLTESADAPHGSIAMTLVHVLAAEMTWLARAREGVTPTDWSALEGLTDLAGLRAAWAVQEEEMRAYLAGVTDAALQQRIHYKIARGAWRDDMVWHALLYVILHAVQHRAEAAALLTRHGESPGNLDFIIYVWEHNA